MIVQRHAWRPLRRPAATMVSNWWQIIIIDRKVFVSFGYCTIQSFRIFGIVAKRFLYLLDLILHPKGFCIFRISSDSSRYLPARQLPAKRKGRGPLFLAQSKKIQPHKQKCTQHGTRHSSLQISISPVEPTSSTPWTRGLPRRRPRQVNKGCQGWQLSLVFMDPFLRRSFVKLSVEWVQTF